MVQTQDTRTGLDRWSSGGDPWPGREGFDRQNAILGGLMAIDMEGTLNARPTAGIRGRWYWATDRDRLFRDTGQAWVDVTPVGGAGAAAPLTFGNDGAEGVSGRAARADHVHPIPRHDDLAHSAVKLSALAAPDRNIDLTGRRFTGAGAPESASDVARLAEVNGLLTPNTIPGRATANGAVGTSDRAARADHRHPYDAPVWTQDGMVVHNHSNGFPYPYNVDGYRYNGNNTPPFTRGERLGLPFQYRVWADGRVEVRGVITLPSSQTGNMRQPVTFPVAARPPVAQVVKVWVMEEGGPVGDGSYWVPVAGGVRFMVIRPDGTLRFDNPLDGPSNSRWVNVEANTGWYVS